MIFSSIEAGTPSRVDVAGNIFAKYMYEYKNNLSAHLIVGGYDPYLGPVIYEISPGGSLTK